MINIVLYYSQYHSYIFLINIRAKIMKIFICLAGILIFASLNCTGKYVITKFDPSSISEYYRQISVYYDGHIENTFEDEDLLQYCETLRKSSFFSITHNTDVSAIGNSQTLSKTYPLPINALNLERRHTVISSRSHDVQNLSPPPVLPSFRCLDLEGNYKWVIAPGFVPRSSFLFKFDSVPNYVYSRLSGNTESNPKLIAIIDEPAQFVREPAVAKFMESIRASRGVQRDPLCDLNKGLQYRICAAVSDQLSLNISVPAERNVTHQLYNLYYQPNNEEESCSSLKRENDTQGDQPDRKFPGLLICKVKLSKSEEFKIFFLSLDALDTNKVISIERDPHSTTLLFQYFHVPLLDQLEVYRNAL